MKSKANDSNHRGRGRPPKTTVPLSPVNATEPSPKRAETIPKVTPEKIQDKKKTEAIAKEPTPPKTAPKKQMIVNIPIGKVDQKKPMIKSPPAIVKITAQQVIAPAKNLLGKKRIVQTSAKPELKEVVMNKLQKTEKA